MAWLRLKDSTLSGSEMSIVTGHRVDLGIGLIDNAARNPITQAIAQI
ncbi:MAG: hypothetical protein WAZ77_10055 [Candidatus Nitrosopolaris sp.]